MAAPPNVQVPSGAPPREAGQVRTLAGRTFVSVGPSGVVPSRMWSPVRQGPIWEAERAVWDARGQGREAERQARAARLELAEGLAASSARSEVIAARVAVLQYRLHAAATGLAGGEELLDMVEFELEAMRWLREGRDSDAEAAELRRKAAPWCRAASTASDPDVREQGARCLDFE